MRFDADAARNAYSRASEVIRMARGRLRGELAMPDGELYGGVHRTSLYFIDHIRCQSESLSSMFIIVQIGVRIEAS